MLVNKVFFRGVSVDMLSDRQVVLQFTKQSLVAAVYKAESCGCSLQSRVLGLLFTIQSCDCSLLCIVLGLQFTKQSLVASIYPYSLLAAELPGTGAFRTQTLKTKTGNK